MVYSEAPRFAGMLRPREYVTVDAEATGERLFVCKSCEVQDGPFAAAQVGAWGFLWPGAGRWGLTLVAAGEPQARRGG